MVGKGSFAKCGWYCSVPKSHLTLFDPVDCSTPGSPVLHCLPDFCSNSCSLSQWCYLTISSSATPFSFCLQSFPQWQRIECMACNLSHINKWQNACKKPYTIAQYSMCHLYKLKNAKYRFSVEVTYAGQGQCSHGWMHRGVPLYC